jgi:hypothetical protein
VELEKSAKQVLPGNKAEGEGREQGGNMTPTMYVHVTKWIIKKERIIYQINCKKFSKCHNVPTLCTIIKNVEKKRSSTGNFLVTLPCIYVVQFELIHALYLEMNIWIPVMFVLVFITAWFEYYLILSFFLVYLESLLFTEWNMFDSFLISMYSAIHITKFIFAWACIL